LELLPLSGHSVKRKMLNLTDMKNEENNDMISYSVSFCETFFVFL